jgi:hypothetical protein
VESLVSTGVTQPQTAVNTNACKEMPNRWQETVDTLNQEKLGEREPPCRPW